MACKKNMPALVRATVLSAFVLLSQGCGLGVFIFGGDETVFENPVMGETRPKLILTSHEAPRVTATELEKYWGEPDRRRVEGGVEYWTYNVGLRWYGLRFMVSFIPLPLQVPVGRDTMTFEVREGLVSRVTVRYDEALFMALCGYYPDPCNFRWFCGSTTLKKRKEDGFVLYDYIGTSDDFRWLEDRPEEAPPEGPPVPSP